MGALWHVHASCQQQTPLASLNQLTGPRACLIQGQDRAPDQPCVGWDKCVTSLSLCAGIMGELNTSRADVAAYPLTLLAPRVAGADMSYSWLNGGIGIMVRPCIMRVLLHAAETESPRMQLDGHRSYFGA